MLMRVRIMNGPHHAPLRRISLEVFEGAINVSTHL
jgi:hypothetical protein